MNRAKFYAALRKRNSGVFGTSLGQSQVKGIEGIFEGFITHGDGREKTLAYALATTVRETGSKMVPVREGFAKTDLGARRAVNKLAKKRGPKSAVARYSKPDGPYNHVYYGRGRVQETWYDNYKRTSNEMGVDFVKHPDLRLDPVYDAQILFSGLQDGRWNGRRKGIAYYLPTNGKDDLKNARRTVNITDHWQDIGGYYKAFLKAIKGAGGIPIAARIDAAARIPKPTPPKEINVPPIASVETEIIQTLLVAAGYKIDIDSRLGRYTRQAIRAFQRTHGLKPDAIVDDKTMAALRRAATPTKTPITTHKPTHKPAVKQSHAAGIVAAFLVVGTAVTAWWETFINWIGF